MVMDDRALHRVMRRGRGCGGRGPSKRTRSERRLQEDLERLQREYLRDGKKLNLLQDNNGGLIDKISALEWDKVALEQERMIVIRTWRTRVRDRVRYFQGAVQEYSGVARKYISAWAQCYQKGPRSF
ncbi:hypothetical protein L6452_34348 [Arctium lappa]|uniref:Uncharacterized protein n=1 Tax=Arctium lappa TaxID=4217 RepID=A0ACB8YII6_ARCLA|nr:hypothetical protein L6452_34348 [Arctium lappa]